MSAACTICADEAVTIDKSTRMRKIARVVGKSSDNWDDWAGGTLVAMVDGLSAESNLWRVRFCNETAVDGAEDDSGNPSAPPDAFDSLHKVLAFFWDICNGSAKTPVFVTDGIHKFEFWLLENYSVECFGKNWPKTAELSAGFFRDLLLVSADEVAGRKDCVRVGSFGKLQLRRAADDHDDRFAELASSYGAQLEDIQFATLGPDAPMGMDNLFNPQGNRALKTMTFVEVLGAYFNLLAERRGMRVWLVEDAPEDANDLWWSIYFVPREESSPREHEPRTPEGTPPPRIT